MITARSDIKYLFIVAVLLIATGVSEKSSLAWGIKGHQIIGRIAAERLSSKAGRGTSDLLGRATLESVANWADQVKMYRNSHFLPIPLDSKDYIPERDCKGECLIRAIESNVAILGNFDQPKASRAEALRYIVHLIGDLHQPLHCADKDDAGGSQLRVYFFGRLTDLHSVWDDDIINHKSAELGAYSRQLSESLGGKGQSGDSYTTGTIVDWALDAHRLAKSAYPKNEDIRLGDEYYYENKRVVDEQLFKAGVRLAKVLNDIFQ